MDISAFVPKEAKNLSACVNCKFIMQTKQWNDVDWTCPNCKTDKTECTTRFSGTTSYIHPENSWVARFNESRKCIPGIYAVHVFIDGEEDNDLEDEQMYSDQDGDFIDNGDSQN